MTLTAFIKIIVIRNNTFSASLGEGYFSFILGSAH